VDACWVWRRNAAKPTKATGESTGICGAPPSADGANPTADNTVVHRDTADLGAAGGDANACTARSDAVPSVNADGGALSRTGTCAGGDALG
jgi:hypothetical protein